ncbi:Uncharacterised protein [uncultured archaeon]|nr:Uncharacterised protein [uncultured archaeon]
MKKNNLIGLFALLLLVAVQIPFTYSATCSLVSPANYNTCLQILNTTLNDSDKDLLISNLDYQDKFFPNHQYIFNRNTNLIISTAPVGVSLQQGIFAKDVWNSLFTTMPSVLYNNSLYVPNKTQVLTGFNVRYVLPANYYSSGYPNTNGGDCQRTYTLTKNLSENRIFVNNIYQGSGKLVNVSINQDSVIKSVFSVNISYSIDHYSWQRYCSKYWKGMCTQWNYRCRYNRNEIQSDNIQTTDQINVKYYNNSFFANITTISSYSSNTNFKLNYSDSVRVNFQDSSYTYDKFSYTINYSKAPYYISTLKADYYGDEQIRNLFKQGNNLIVKNSNNCSIQAFDFFNLLNKSCFVEQKPVNFRIETDKLKYSLNETIKVYVYPQNISVNISYGNQSKIITGNTTFKTESLKNKIIAFNESSKAERVIYVQEQERFAIIYNLSIFGLINYVLLMVLKRCFGGLV